MKEYLVELDLEAAVSEARPFLMEPAGIEMLNRPNLFRLLEDG